MFVQTAVDTETKRGLWDSAFFVLAGLLSIGVMEVLEGNLRRFLFLAFSTTLIFVITAFWLFRRQKITFATYIATFSAPALFIAFIFLIPFLANSLWRQLGIIMAGSLIIAIPYLTQVFVIEGLAFGLLSFSLYRFKVVLEAPIFFLLAIYLLIAWGLATLAYAKFPEVQEKIRIGLPAVLALLVQLFLIFLIMPINLGSRGILMGVSFYFIFEFIALKTRQAMSRKILARNIILLSATYVFILLSAHWV